tara:strand:+ start:2860 stop:3156 length:297 start_codon:yes stop_codon:yes gene_type:complete
MLFTENPSPPDDVATAADAVPGVVPGAEVVWMLDAAGVDIFPTAGKGLELVGVERFTIPDTAIGVLDGRKGVVEADSVFSAGRFACGGMRSYHLAPVL